MGRSAERRWTATVFDAVPFPGQARSFGPQASLLGVERQPLAIVSRRLFQCVRGYAEQHYGLPVGFEQSGVFDAQGAFQGHFFRLFRRAGGRMSYRGKICEAAVGSATFGIACRPVHSSCPMTMPTVLVLARPRQSTPWPKTWTSKFCLSSQDKV